MSNQISCRDLIDFLDDYVANRQAPDQRAEFDRHLADCKHCVDYLRTYQDTIRLARGALAGQAAVLPADPPQELIDAVIAARKARRDC